VKLPDPPLLLVTDRTQARRPLDEVVARACAAGCRWISIREKDLPREDQIALARALRPIARRSDARLTLHGDAELAREAGVDGVHLAAGSDTHAARRLLGSGALIGLSIHSVSEAADLDGSVLDYAIAGPAYITASKPGYGPALGPDGMSAIVRASPVPVIAIGGIAADVVAAVMRAAVAGIAVMGGVMRAVDPAAEMANLLQALPASERRASSGSSFGQF
jgi:thiamine-phosphate pyrophosphorylase